MSTVEDRLAALGISLPQPVAPVDNYVPTVRSGDLLYISGQVSIDESHHLVLGQRRVVPVHHLVNRHRFLLKLASTIR